MLDAFLDAVAGDKTHVMEFRHASWYERGVLNLLDRRAVAFCVHDYGSWHRRSYRTGPVAYVRFHGTSGQYSGSYPDDQLEEWAKKVRELGRGADRVYCYFNNDVGGHAVRNRPDLEWLLGR